MNSQEDEKALVLLEKAVYRAKHLLKKTKCFQPFLMLLTDSNDVEIHENEVKDTLESYALLEALLEERVKKGDIDILILVVDTIIPEKLSEKKSMGIRLHLEEKSQRDKTIGARFIYVPYELCKVKNESMYVRLHHPLPVGFPAEYIC